jgi:hypothetical protein
MHAGIHDAPRGVAFGHPRGRPGRSSGNRAAFTRARGDTCGRLVRAIGPGRPSGLAPRMGGRTSTGLLRKERLARSSPTRAMASAGHSQDDRRWEWVRGSPKPGPPCLPSPEAQSRHGAGLPPCQRRGHPNGAGLQHGKKSSEEGNDKRVADPERGTDLREDQGSGGRNPMGATGMKQGRNGSGWSARRETVRNRLRRQVGGW